MAAGDEILTTASGAARTVTEEGGGAITADAIRYHERLGHLPSIRTHNGVRLFKMADVRAFARARRREREARGVA